MSLLDGVRLEKRTRHQDRRGWLLKVEEFSSHRQKAGPGEIYVTFSSPGQSRGGHFHRRNTERFTVLQGRARFELEDPEHGRQRSIELAAEQDMTIIVPVGVAHQVVALGDSPLLLLAVASEVYDPSDTLPYPVKIRSTRG